MQGESLATVEHASALSASVLETRWSFPAERGDQIVRVAHDSHCLRLLLDVLDLNLLLLLLLLLLKLKKAKISFYKDRHPAPSHT